MSDITQVETEEEVEVETMLAEESQVVVHCICMTEAFYRIWPTTFLIEHNTGKMAKLITAFNVSFSPHWTAKYKGQKFTLIFEGLSRNCMVFDLKEMISEPDGFEVKGIVRNSSDVYTVEIA